MRSIILAFFAGVLSALAASANLAPAFAADNNEPAHFEHPGVVALSQEGDGKWVYKAFPSFLPLYTYDGDDANKSNCDSVCIAVWPIVRASADEKPVGDWTIVERDGGDRQWAYKGRPVYTFFEDTPGKAEGVGLFENWYYEPGAANRRPAKPTDDKRAIWRQLTP